MSEERISDPFEGSVVCECETTMPEEIKKIIPKAYTEEDMPYLCNWCEFVRQFGMAGELESIMKRTVKPVTQTMPDDSAAGMEMGIWFVRDYEEYANMRAFFGAVVMQARESLKLSRKDVSEKLDLPEYVLENLERGEEEIQYKREEDCTAAIISSRVVPIRELSEEEAACLKRKWWEGKQDIEIEALICNFLLEQKKSL